MTTRFYLCFAVCFTATVAMAQPQLLTDFNPGTADGMTDSLGYEGAYLDDNRMILAVIDPDFGTELGILENGELSLLKDINPGMEGSDPQYFVRYNGKVYFSVADDGQVFASLWSTDGTEEGTVKEYSLSGNAEPIANLVVTDGGELLFHRVSGLYSTSDGENFEQIQDDLSIIIEDGRGNEPYTKYKDGFAFLKRRTSSPNDIELWYYEAGNLELLHSFPDSELGLLTVPDALGQIDGGLVFSIDGSVEGTFVYAEATGEVTEVLEFPCDRYLKADGVDIVGFREGGFSGESVFYRFSTNPAEATVLFDEQPILSLLTSGTPFPHIGTNNKLVFLGQASMTGNANKALYMTDGTVTGTVKLGDLPLPGGNLQMLAKGRYVFVVVHFSDISPVSIYVADTEAATVTELYQFPESTGPEGSILLTGFQDGKLYFNLSADETVGRELYTLETGLVVAEESVAVPSASFGLEFADRQFAIQAEGMEPARVNAYDVQGRLLRSYDTHTNAWLPEVIHSGMVLYEVEVDGQRQAWKRIGLR